MRTVVVTGGTRGIGLAIAARLAADGWDVLAAARTPRSGLPAGVRFAACDVTDAVSVMALFGGLARLDALVTAAGLAGANRLAADEPLWGQIIAANLTGTWHCCAAAQDKLPERDGRIVTVGSVLGLRAVADQTAYCAAKHGVVGLSRALALALAPRGITVNTVCPGWVETDMARARFAELGIDAAAAARGVPLGRIATAADVAGVVAFLLSAAAGHITGQELVVDGGGSVSA